MDITDKIKAIAQKIENSKSMVSTEEGTKTAFVMPFIDALGYDIFNPAEVTPEYTADLGLKKGEKVDYAIQVNGEPIIIIECKHWKEKLDVHNSQLFRYFAVTKTRFGILTNGIEYRFYSDLEEINKMDDKPFLEIDFENLKESSLAELQKFHINNFDVDKILNNASTLKYLKGIKSEFIKELNSPSDEFIKFFGSRIYEGRLTEKVMESFRNIVPKALGQVFSERVNERLQNALSSESRNQEEVIEEVEESKIITTEEELEGFMIVVSILRKLVDRNRIYYRDAQSYFSIILDDNNRKPICRLHLNGKTKYLGLFNDDKKENKIIINSIDDIYSYDKELVDTLDLYENT